MAELAKKLNFLKDGVHQTAKAYSTTIETGGEYITNIIDGVTCYIPVGNESDGRATKARILKSGATKAIFNTGKPVYTEKSWTTAGTYTWTVPAGVTRVRVAVCGGGAGGMVFDGSPDTGITFSGKGGGNSSFGNLVSVTGAPAVVAYLRYNSSAKSYKWSLESWDVLGGSPNGRSGGCNRAGWSYGGKGFALSFTMNDGNYGTGGNAFDDNGGLNYGFGGGSGGFSSGYYNVTAGENIVITVGAGGAKVEHRTTRYLEPYDGTSGFVLIAYGGDI